MDDVSFKCQNDLKYSLGGGVGDSREVKVACAWSNLGVFV